ncbi:MAG TPA: mannosyltransferase family protein [Thermoleophilaceae bacterium]|nr:mannosyltransferase family protein [Thermoleophilaceae bacterium]
MRRALALAAAGAAESEALRAAARVWLWSRIAILVVAIPSALAVGAGGIPGRNAERFDDPALTHPLGGVGDALLAPLARWDAVWYLSIADSGYGHDDSPSTAFFPLYPLLVRGVGELGGGSRGALLVASYVVALVGFLGALYLLFRLVTLELGPRVGTPTLVLLCAFPGSLFFGAPYSESLFLLVSVGAFYAARTGRWAWAGMAAAAASGTRSAGILLLVPLAILYLYGPRSDRPGGKSRREEGLLGALRPVHAIRPEAGWLVLAPAGLIAYAAYLGLSHGDPLAFSSVQDSWAREFAGPLGGAWDGLVAAWAGARQLLSGSREHVFFQAAAGDPFRVSAHNLMLFGFLAFGLCAAVGVLRRLPFAYGAYVTAALMLPLSYPVGPQPLMSLPRFLAVLFPIFMWLALFCEERRITGHATALSAVVLCLFVSQFAGWYWVA